MMNKHLDIHDAYISALRNVWYNYEYRCSPRGLPIREITDYTFRVTIPICEPIETADEERNKVIERYTKQEVDLYNACTNRVEDFAKASKFWNKLVNPDECTINSAYGYLIWKNRSVGNPKWESGIRRPCQENSHCQRTPWDWCVESLRRDKDTRQAILRFSLPEHQWFGNKDQVCTMHGNFLIRDDCLNLIIIMRSNDLMKGLVYDLPWFVSLIDRMVDDLKDTYPNLRKGTYTHMSHSMHIYEKDEAAILKMIGE